MNSIVDRQRLWRPSGLGLPLGYGIYLLCDWAKPNLSKPWFQISLLYKVFVRIKWYDNHKAGTVKLINRSYLYDYLYALSAYSQGWTCSLTVKWIHPIAVCQEPCRILRLQCEIYKIPILKEFTELSERKVYKQIMMVLSNHTIVEIKIQCFRDTEDKKTPQHAAHQRGINHVKTEVQKRELYI